MMTRQIDNVFISKQLADGDSIGKILLSTLSPDIRLSLARCTVVRYFDQELFDEHLKIGAPSFDRLAENGWIKALDQARRWYCVASHVRDDAWNSWWLDTTESKPQQLIDLADELAEYYRDHDQPIELLRQLVISKPAAAAKLFDAIYQKADADFDLVRCQDAVGALGEYGRDRFLAAGLRERRDQCQRRIWARSAWATDFLQTADSHFQPRKAAQGRLKHLLQAGSAGPWLLQLYGWGGMGKTMLLRHFVSQECVGRPLIARDQLIASARIDGDAVDPAVLLECPWLLLVEAAAQLNRQLPDGPFTELLNSFGSYRGLLRRMPHDLVVADTSDPSLVHAGKQVEAAFCRALAVSSRVMIVLDTLDYIVELGSSAPDRLSALVRMLCRVHDAAEALRVVLAGREDLRPIIGDAMPKERADHVELTAFTDDEAKTYLVHRRKIADAAKVDAIIGRCFGMPIFLAGLADEVENDPALTANDIGDISQHYLVNYMNDRVLKRISDPIVSWSLRFSVVPPALSFEFFCDVMLPELREVGLDLDLLGSAAQQSWEAGVTRGSYPVPFASEDAKIEQIWHAIVAAANKSRWMYSESSADQELVIAHAIVRAPLRDDVRGRPAFSSLHERAVEYYQGRIDEDQRREGSWIRWQREIIFHLFQLPDDSAATKWRDAVRSAHDLGRPGWAGELAEYVLGPDFYDASGRPDHMPGQVLYEAHVERALVIAQGAGRLPAGSASNAGSVIWPDEAEAALNSARDERRKAGDNLTTIGLETDLRALLAVETRQWEKLAELDPSLADADRKGRDTGRNTPEACLVRARALKSRPSDGDDDTVTERAWQAYRQARDAYGNRPECVDYVDDEAVRWLLGKDRPDLGYRWAKDSHLARLRAETLLALAMPASALAALDGESSPRGRYLAARAQLALHQPKAALDELPDDEPGYATPGPDLVKPLIDQHLIRAGAYGQLFELDEASRCLSSAQSLINDADEVTKARVDTCTALFELRVTDDVCNAKNHLDQEFPALAEGSAEWTRFQLARAELADRQGSAADVRRILKEVRSCLLTSGMPTRSRVKVTLAGLAARSLSPEERIEYLDLLADELSGTRPSAWLAMLTGLRRCPPVLGAGEPADRLRDLVTTMERDNPVAIPDARDKACQSLTLAYLFRVIGDDYEYRRLRADAWRTLKDDDLYLAWELLAADAEFSEPHYPEVDPDRFTSSYGDYPMLVARFIVESVSQSGDFASSGWRLSDAEELLENIQGADSVCGARLFEVKTIGAATSPDPELQEGATELANMANAVWARLGDPRRITPAGKILPGGQPDAPEPATVVQANVIEARIFTDQTGSDVCVERREGTREGKPYAVRWGQAIARRWADESASSWGRATGDLLGPGFLPLPGQGSGRELDVHAEFPSPRLAVFPWELVEIDGEHLASHPRVRVVRSVEGAYQGRREVMHHQRVLNALRIDVGIEDGIVGPKYQAGIKKLLKLCGHPGEQTPSQETWERARDTLRERAEPGRQLNVLLVQPDVGGNLNLLRRFGERMNELIRAYRAAFKEAADETGVELVISDMSGGEVASLLWQGSKPQPVDVLHICTVMEATEQMPVLGLDVRGGPPLDAAEVDQMVRLMTRTRAMPPLVPLVVLDVQAPPSPADVRRQLLMRNRFAHQLIELGNVDAVIATGLEMRRDVTAQWEIITTGLARQRNAAEICREIQQIALAPDVGQAAREAHLVANVGSALFTNVHPGVLVEPGLLS
jgi:cellulose synthase operon protein C